MGSYGAYIFSRRVDLDGLLVELDLYLDSRGEELLRTRKGRVWEVLIDPEWFDVSVRDTDNILGEVEDDLLEADLLPEDAPFTITVASRTRLGNRMEYINRLVRDITRLSRGSATTPST